VSRISKEKKLVKKKSFLTGMKGIQGIISKREDISFKLLLKTKDI
jgi:hypothetical protein